LNAQLAFGFESTPRTLVDDATGHIFYTPRVVAADVAAAWFATLYDTIEWQRERRPMYDRIVDVPRLIAWFGAGDPLPPELEGPKRAVEAFAQMRFNSVGLNLYRDERDSVAMHSDRNEMLARGTPVVLLSLGAARRMHIASKAKPRRNFDVLLEPGSIFTMGGAAQENWEHGIPKGREPVGMRISLAFRSKAVDPPSV
jgi:alkylated DNA repair dioxygenase AlkB